MVRLTVVVVCLLALVNISAIGQQAVPEGPLSENAQAAQHADVRATTQELSGSEPVSSQIPSETPGPEVTRPIPQESGPDTRKMVTTDDDDVSKTMGSDRRRSFQWSAATRQALLFLSLQHGFALATQSKTRESLKGPFFKDYFQSVGSLGGWGDGGRFFTNYVAHPMQGSFLGWIQVQNDPGGRSKRFGRSAGYWKSRTKALAWSAAWSTQFEIGPISQASIGNVGQKGKQTWIDIVMTPTLGTAMLVTEDILDRYIIKAIERRTRNRYVKYFVRMLLNPTRTTANAIAFKNPWHRDRALR